MLLEAVGRAADASAAFSKARQLDPDDPVAAYLVATRSASDAVDLQPLIATLMDASDRRRAMPPRPFADLSLIRDLSARTPEFSPAAYVAVFTAFAQRRFREALDGFRTAIARDPLITDPAARSKALLDGVAALRAKNGRRRGGPPRGRRAVVAESSEAHRVLGIVYRAVGRLSESIEQFGTAVRLRPDDERARVAWGSALIEAGRSTTRSVNCEPRSGAALLWQRTLAARGPAR
jgi:tetratricopeptide (TPR) repeat protein